MIKNHIQSVLTEELGFAPTPSQVTLIKKLAGFISSSEEDIIFLLKGFAGTGKTSMLAVVVRALLRCRIPSVLLAPTGRAAKVLSGYTAHPAFTIHKKIYRQKSQTQGLGKFVLDKNLHKNTYFIVDEASMISNEAGEISNFGSGRLLDDLVEYVYTGQHCRLLLVGDTAQLPPVGLDLSPALEAKELRKYGFGAEESCLTEVARHSEKSGILMNATQVRQRIEKDNRKGFFPIRLKGFQDIERISGDLLVEKITECYERYGVYETIVVTRSNKRASLYNKGIRNTIFFREEQISRGDLLMVVKNNYFWMAEQETMDFIANGDIAKVETIYGLEEIYGFRFADVRLNFIDYEDVEFDGKIMLDTIDMETASLSSEESKKLYDAISQDYPEVKNKRTLWKKIRDNPWFNALQVKFAYAVTCHKAQGGQWKAVFVDPGYITEERINKEYLRWMYTAFTRPVEKLYLVNFNSRFFEEENPEASG
jgi:exodeoxyribonuclease V